jgi:alpha-D-xyloside xylohydrolase
MDGEQYHSMFGLLCSQVLMEALDGKQTLSEVRNMGALAAPYPFVLYSDLYDHKDFIRGVTTAPFSGLLWSPELRDAASKEELLRRLQVVVFSNQCLINAWYCPDLPWREFGCEDEVRELLKLRVQLMPMLHESFKIYRSTGKPPIRALVMDFTDDEKTYTVDDEFLFCEDILVAPIAAGYPDQRDVYLPRSARWADFFTGQEIDVPEDGILHVETKGIPVYKRIRE